MKKLALAFLLIAFFKLPVFSAGLDSVYQRAHYASVLDSLKQKLDLTPNDSLKAGVYIQIAAQYLRYDTVADKKTKLFYQNQALSYTMLALHGYSKYNDSVGLMVTFNNLARVYRSQKKYSQAKWFILQSNTLSRDKNDLPNIVASLTMLAGIKMDIKDYSLAKRDLDEALKISATNHYAKAEADVQQNYAFLYSQLKEYDKEAIALRRHNFIEDSIRKAEESKLVAKINVQDTVQRKKKLNMIGSRKSYKTSSAKRIASL